MSNRDCEKAYEMETIRLKTLEDELIRREVEKMKKQMAERNP